MLEQLQSAWEKKRDSPKYTLYKDMLNDGLEKVGKYYSRLNEKPSFVLALSKTLIPLMERHILINPLKCFTHITSLPTSRWLGVVLTNKRQKLQQETLMQRTSTLPCPTDSCRNGVIPLESTGVDRNPHEWHRNPQEWHRNPQEWTGMDRNGTGVD